jgi:small neutral amino acid transporter SnatA (MarC family)
MGRSRNRPFLPAHQACGGGDQKLWRTPPGHPCDKQNGRCRGRQCVPMDHTFLSALVLLLLVLDPIGSLPVFISVMRNVVPERRARVALRESALAFAVLVLFMLTGQWFLTLMRSDVARSRGSVIRNHAMQRSCPPGRWWPRREPLIFPLAVPLLAGPSAMATVLLLASRQPERLLAWIGALTVAMVVSAAVLLGADRIRKWIGTSMVSAIEKLMGLVLTAIAVEMILAGLRRYFFES